MPGGDGGEQGDGSGHETADAAARRATICVSSQIGCAVNCQFCLTAKLGCSETFRRERSPAR